MSRIAADIERSRSATDSPWSTEQESRALPARSSQAGGRASNISSREKTLSTVGGSALVIAGLARGKLSGLLMTALGGALVYRGWTGHCHAYEALGIDTSEENSHGTIRAGQGVKVEKTLLVNRSAEELFSFWRQVENLPRVMRHLQRVTKIDDTRSRWVAEGPLGKAVEWEAEIFNEEKPELIAWRSLPGSDVETAGSVHFKSLGHNRGTAVEVSLKYNPPAGKLGATVASLLGSGVQQEVEADLRRFKSMMEAGEAPRVDGQPRGPRG